MSTCSGCGFYWQVWSTGSLQTESHGMFAGTAYWTTPGFTLSDFYGSGVGTIYGYVYPQPGTSGVSNGRCTGVTGQTGCSQTAPCMGVSSVLFNPVSGHSVNITAINQHTGNFNCGTFDYVTFYVTNATGGRVSNNYTVDIFCLGC